MANTKRWILLGLAAGALAVTGCRDRSEPLEPEGVGGSGYETEEERLGDGKVGEEEGVINDGEGPFEDDRGVFQDDSQMGDGTIGEEEGVINDGEGPLENTEQMLEEEVAE